MNRWDAGCETPNQAAVVLACAGMVCLVSLAAAQRTAIRNQSHLPQVVAAMMALVALAAGIGLAATQSRAGLLSYVIALGVAWLWRGLSGRWALTAGLLAVTAAIAWPGGPERLSQIAEGTASGERFIAWRGALALINDHPIFGVGRDFPTVLGAWYLPEHLEGRFVTALNDIITCAGWFGIPACAGLVGAFSLLVALAWRQRSDFPISLCMCVLAIVAVTGLFQAHLWAALPEEIAVGTLLLLCISLVRSSRRSAQAGFAMRSALIWGVLATVISGATLFVAASMASQRAAWKTWSYGELLLAGPRTGLPKGMVLMLSDDAADARRLRRGLACAARDAGWGIMETSGNALPEALENARRRGVDIRIALGWHEAAIAVWKAANAHTLGRSAVALDPHGLDLAGDHGVSDPLLVLATRFASFQPSPEEILAALGSSVPPAKLVMLSRADDDSYRWSLIEKWASPTKDAP